MSLTNCEECGDAIPLDLAFFRDDYRHGELMRIALCDDCDAELQMAEEADDPAPLAEDYPGQRIEGPDERPTFTESRMYRIEFWPDMYRSKVSNEHSVACRVVDNRTGDVLARIHYMNWKHCLADLGLTLMLSSCPVFVLGGTTGYRD